MTPALSSIEMRLAEQDHRIANMLQLAACLLESQAARATDKFTADAILAAGSQVRAFALLNNALREPGRGIACGTVYLRALCGHLNTACLAPRGLELTLNLPCGAPMACRNAQAMGLLVVEAAMNAAKHAFPDNRRGRLSITLAPSPAASHLECTVTDDGVGMEVAGKAAGGGLGVAFMRALATSLGCNLLIQSCEAGSSVSFRVPQIEGWGDSSPFIAPPRFGSERRTSSRIAEVRHGQA